ncbi:hypothetical protein GCM10011390_04060 [Aureimonas endophytica]|uniref:Uncharacterized protein n=1 Tax=Aureimonas endophytica TaxID=2027858 RepID=A0A917E0B3_9HYPH|nr:hypothetical protein [Aureimonas endophytica]GGD88508.1 hypothetical protein GCM10011390_04060 [Aureimonas endophytica]
MLFSFVDIPFLPNIIRRRIRSRAPIRSAAADPLEPAAVPLARRGEDAARYFDGAV